MLRITLTAMLLCFGMFLTGCQTMTSDKDQQIRKYSRISDINRRMLAEDIDVFLLLDRPSRLSKLHVRTR
jgi:hypothetical protein